MRALLMSMAAMGGIAGGAVLGAAGTVASEASQTFQVSGSGVHHFSGAVIHGQQPTETGMVRRSTETVVLTGDLTGHVLYHATTQFDFVDNTAVTTGTQLFSGSVRGSEPVLLHDDRFRFDVALSTGAVSGEVHLARAKDAPHDGRWFECDLTVVGTGMTPAGDGTFDYHGTCTPRGRW